jgi:disease resistance protein RPM1
LIGSHSPSSGHLFRSFRRLKKQRYLTVLDDVWTIGSWYSFKLIFPDNSKEGSGVLVTTRNGTLAEVCSPPLHIHQLEFLKKEDAKKLFLKKINKAFDDIEDKDTFENILNKCGRLPLATVTIGSLLANKPTKKWKDLYNQLPTELETNPSLEALKRVVNLSYNHLPSHLKPCFLYLSIFPEDLEITRKHLLNRWIAEGFVANDTTGRTLEEVAESYFYELIGRSMIQPSKLSTLGNVKTCRVHDIVRDIAVSISRTENHVFIVDQHTSTIAATQQSTRHLSYFAEKKMNTGLVLSGVRSLTLFNGNSVPLASFKMLRVLDLRYGAFRKWKQDINIIGSLVHLKYLHFPRSIPALPKSIRNLKGLQTLEVELLSTSGALPTEITKLQNLRNLRCTYYSL